MPLFQSFWWAGFEGADHHNATGAPVDANESNRHRDLAPADYRRLAAFGIRTVRESVGWRLSERDGGFSFRHLERRAAAAADQGIQIAWTLCHYGLPADLHPADPALPDRFARFCAAAVRFLRPWQVGTPVYTPINEISFYTWAVTQTPPEMRFPARDPSPADAHVIKRNLVAASLAGIAAIRDVEPTARILLTDPLIRVVPPAERPELAAVAAAMHASQFENWDLHAEASVGGGSALDLVGVNYYHANQWEYPGCRTLMWHLDDPRRVPLAVLLRDLWERYRRPIVIAETSHVGAGRPAWLRHVSDEVIAARAAGVGMSGICLYPVIDRPDWNDPSHWHKSGLWDVARDVGLPTARQPPDADRLPPGAKPIPIHASTAGRDASRGLDHLYARELRRCQTRLGGSGNPCLFPKGSRMTALLVYSHLRWNFVFQRPQHLLSRLARHYPVLFVEEPVQDDHAWLEQVCPAPNVRVLVPHLPGPQHGFSAGNAGPIAALLTKLLGDEQISDYVAWLYTPMALPQLDALAPRAVIYDCMDELRNFRGAPVDLADMEARLLARADLVFTGGPSLYEARRDRHPDVHCFPSSVDREHFAAGRDPTLEDLRTRHLARPRLGFFGVLDERLDIELVAHLATSRPDWSLVLVGPVVKIDEAQLPKLSNISYLGQQPYADLPGFIAGWDVCLLPFALNEATRFISPTKTLEYMAAERPIVSTPVRDVVKLYGEAVRVAATPEEFLSHCAAALAERPAERRQRLEATQAILARTSWDETASRMQRLLQRTLERRRSRVSSLPAATPGRTERISSRAPAVVIGAGPTGLSASFHIGRDALLLEQADRVGGLCRSIQDQGFTFDHAGHIMFSNDPYVHELYRMLLGDNVRWQDREAWIYSHGVYTRYPFQGALYGLPPKILKECILGAIEARFGSLSGRKTDAPAPPGDSCRVVNGTPVALPAGTHEDCCGDGTDIAAGTLDQDRPGRSRNFHDFIYETWGAGIARHFAIPYNRKLWACPLEEIETSWLEGRVPLPDLEEMIDGAVEPVAKPQGPNARFGYPLRGGFQALMDGFLPHLKGELRCNARVSRISPSRKLVTLANGETVAYRVLVSTMPLPALIRAIGAEAPPAVREAAAGLRSVSLRCVNIGVGRENLTEKHWIYYPGDTVFHRIFVQGNTSPHCNPPGGFGLTCEITYSPDKPLPCDGEDLIRLCIDDCIRVGLFTADDPIITAHIVDVPLAYVVYDHARTKNVGIIRSWLDSQDILLAGRYSEWEYYNSDHAFLAGRRVAEEATARLKALRPSPVPERSRSATAVGRTGLGLTSGQPVAP